MNFSHRAFEPYRPLLARLPQDRTPTPVELTALAEEAGLPLFFIETTGALSACDYEQGILQSGSIPTRPGNVHDFMNALAWLTFPQLKASLNRAHCRMLADSPTEAKQRSRKRDAITLLDESGVLVFTEDEAFHQLLARRRWQEAFVHRRQFLMDHSQFLLIGHAVMQKLLDPYPAITAKCLVISSGPKTLADADALSAVALNNLETPTQLPPLPVSGIPGWDPHNHLPAFYDNTSIFRPLAY